MVDSEALQLYVKPAPHEESKAPSRGFVVRDAPWTASSSEKVRLSRPAPARAPRRPFQKLLGGGGGGGLVTEAQPSLPPQAPDMSSSEEFPSFGAQVAPKTLPWGPKR